MCVEVLCASKHTAKPCDEPGGQGFHQGKKKEVATAEDTSGDVEDIKAPTPTLGQVMHALDLLQMFAGTHEDTEGTLDTLQTYEKSVRPLLTKRMQTNITEFFDGK